MLQFQQRQLRAHGMCFTDRLMWRDPRGLTLRVVTGRPGPGEIHHRSLPEAATLELAVDPQAEWLAHVTLPRLRYLRPTEDPAADARTADAALWALAGELAAMAPGPARNGWLLALSYSVRSVPLGPDLVLGALCEVVLADGQDEWLDGCAPLLASQLTAAGWTGMSAAHRAAYVGVMDREPHVFFAALDPALWTVLLADEDPGVVVVVLQGLSAWLSGCDPHAEVLPDVAVGRAVLALAQRGDVQVAEPARGALEGLVNVGTLCFEELVAVVAAELAAASAVEPERAYDWLCLLGWLTPALEPERELFWSPDDPAEVAGYTTEALEAVVALVRQALACGNPWWGPAAELAASLAGFLDAVVVAELAAAFLDTGDPRLAGAAQQLLARASGCLDTPEVAKVAAAALEGGVGWCVPRAELAVSLGWSQPVPQVLEWLAGALGDAESSPLPEAYACVLAEALARLVLDAPEAAVPALTKTYDALHALVPAPGARCSAALDAVAAAYAMRQAAC